MPTTATDMLRNLRVDEIMEDAQDVRTPPGKLKMLARLKQVDADNNELFAKHQGRVQIAPMVAMDAKAPVFKAERFSLESNTLQKIKFGTHWTEKELSDWMDLAASPMKDPKGIISGNVVRRTVERQALGIDHRKEALAVAMALDGQYGTGSYSQYGYIFDNVSFGRYSDLKRTVSIPWEGNPTTAKPITDLRVARDYADERYGISFDRLTLPRSAFRAAIATDEFQKEAQVFRTTNVNPIPVAQVVTPYQIGLFEAVTGLKIEFYDTRFETQNDDLSWNNYRFWPLNPACPIMLDNSADDGDSTVQDFGMGVALEGAFADARFAANLVSMPAANVHRAISYATIKGDLDPIGLTIFSACVCFPRLYKRDSNLVINIGSVTETIPVTDLSPA